MSDRELRLAIITLVVAKNHGEAAIKIAELYYEFVTGKKNVKL